MTHRYLELPFSGDVAAFDDRIAWIRSHLGGVQAAAIDIATGATRLVTVGAHDLGRGSLAPIGGAIAATVGRHAAVEWFDTATGASVRKTEGALCGVTSRASLVVQAIRARLDLPARVAKQTKAPDWFLAAHGKKPAGSIVGDVAHERKLVRALRDAPDDAAAKSQLLALYERLGWRWHAEQVRTAEG